MKLKLIIMAGPLDIAYNSNSPKIELCRNGNWCNKCKSFRSDYFWFHRKKLY